MNRIFKANIRFIYIYDSKVVKAIENQQSNINLSYVGG